MSVSDLDWACQLQNTKKDIRYSSSSFALGLLPAPVYRTQLQRFGVQVLKAEKKIGYLAHKNLTPERLERPAF